MENQASAAKQAVGFYTFDCGFLEDATWNALCAIAAEQDCTVDDLCLTIGHEFPDADFTQAARSYVLRHYAAPYFCGLLTRARAREMAWIRPVI